MAGVVGRMAYGAWSRVPFTTARRQRRVHEEVERTEALERARQRAGQPDQRTVSGDHTSTFNKAFIDAIRRGQSRTEVAGTPDMLIREVICNPRFIRAIRNTTVPSPLEEHDSTYAYQSAERRAVLAGQLEAATVNRRNVVPNLSAQDLDIIYSLMIRRPDVWTELPHDEPRPPEVFMQFLEAVAQRQSAGKEGEFIGMVLKDLSTKRTFTDSKERPNGTIMDPDYASTYLYRQSAELLEHAVTEFGRLVREVLETPTDAQERTVGVPGLGYAQAYGNASYEREQRVRDLEQAVYDINGERRPLRSRIMAAEERIEEYVRDAHGAVRTAQQEEQGVLADVNSTDAAKAEATRNRTQAERTFESLRNQVQDQEYAHDDIIREQLGIIRGAREEITRLDSDLQAAQRELHEATESLRRFSAEAGVDAVARQVTDHFRTLLIENRETGADALGVADRIAQRLPNVMVTRLLDRANELLGEKEALAQHLRQPEPQPVPVGQVAQPAPARPDYQTLLQPRIGEYTARVDRLEREIADAQLPQPTTRRLQMVTAALRDWEIRRDFVEAQITDTRNNNALPLRQVALRVVERMNQRGYENIVGISDAQRLIALQIWEATSEIEPSATRGESWWAKTKHKMAYHILSGRGWRQKGNRLWQHSLGSDLDYLTHNPRGRVMGRDLTDQGQGGYYQTVWPRWLRGTLGLATKGVIGTALVGGMVGLPETTWYKPWTWMAANAHVESNDWYRPWTWLMPLEGEKKVVRIIHDHYDIPERLTTRGSAYYREAYGVGAWRLGEEKDDIGATARLAWIQTRQPVLVFMQERKTMRVVTKVEKLSNGLQTCGTSVTAVPKSCNDLGLKTVEDVEAYRPVEADKWKPGMQICCTVKMEFNTIRDGLRLNTNKSDEFVAELMAEEGRGTEITYEYLNNPSNRMKWVQAGYLVSELESMVMDTHKITNLSNVQFLLSQGTNLSGLRAAMSEVGDAEYQVREADRDDFLTDVRRNISRIASGMVPPMTIDPTVENVPAEILDRAVDITVEQGKSAGSVIDTHVEFERKTVQKELGGYTLDQEALDICVVQTDIREFLKEFTKAGVAYRLNVERAGDFVRILAQSKSDGVDITDFGPGGSRLNWAMATGLITQVGSGIEQTTTETMTLNPEGHTFYEKNIGFDRKLDGIITDALAETGANGVRIRDVLATKFEGNEDKLREAIKADWYGEIAATTTNPTKKGVLEGNGVIITPEEDGSLTVSLDGKKATDTLRSRVVVFARQK
ncbi:MAG: hypothetical protein ABID61_04975 [Candidatus Micrarchaeota archaeon]